MRFQSTLICFFLGLNIVSLYACAVPQDFSVQQHWPDNVSSGQDHEQVINHQEVKTEGRDPSDKQSDDILTSAIWVALVAVPIIIIFVLRP